MNHSKEKILQLIRQLNKYISYNNFHFIVDIIEKDNFYRNYRRMNKKFPEDYNFMQESYVLPDDTELIKKKI